MPEIKPFRGWRYNPTQNKDLSKVLAPPYDVISPAQQKRLYEENHYNVIRVELGADEPGDKPGSDKYSRAADYLKRWKKFYVLTHEEKPSLYVYVQDYREEGKNKTRIGFLSLMKLDEKAVLKHENTLTGPKEDRLHLLKATRTNLSPIFGLFEDPKGTVQENLKKTTKTAPIVDVTMDDVRHRVYLETREPVIKAIQKCLKTKPMYIADGHHRFETALNFKKLSAGKEKLSGQHGWEYVLTYFTDCLHNPFKIFPTHRLIKVPSAASFKKLASRGSIETAYSLGAVLGHLDAYREEVPGKPYDFGIYTKADGYKLFRLNASYSKKVKNNPVDRLDVAVLHKMIIEPCFGIKKIEKSPSIDFTRDPKDAVARVDSGDFDAALFLRPTSLQEMILASKKGLKMPQKSTYFYPKLLSGLVFHSFEDGIQHP